MKHDGLYVCACAGVVVLVIFMIGWAIQRNDEFKEHCRVDLHGHYKKVTGYKSSTWYCLSDDGRILDVE